MKKALIVILTAVLLTPVLCGCYDYQEPNDIAYIIAIGIDEGEKDYLFTLQFARPAQISGGSAETGGEGEKTMDFVTIEAPSIYSAVNVANQIISKTFTLAHTKIIVISEKIAKKSIVPIADVIGRTHDIRPSVFLCVSVSSAQKYLESVNPTIEINPVKYYRLIFENPNSTYIAQTNTLDVYLDLKAKTRQIALPVVGVGNGVPMQSNQSQSTSTDSAKSGGNSSQSKESPGGDSSDSTNQNIIDESNPNAPVSESPFEYHIKEYIAGQLDAKKQNSSEAIGTAVFKDGKLIDYLTNVESEVYNILSGDYKQGYAVIYSKNTPDTPITVRIEQDKKPKIKIKIEDGIPKIKISLSLDGTLISTPHNYIVERDLETFEADASEYIKNSALGLLKKTAAEYHSDIIGFGNHAKRLFLTNAGYDDFNWNKNYKNSEFECDVDFKIVVSGLLIRPEENEVG